MSESDGSSLATELELLEAMFPAQVNYNTKSRDFKFMEQSALLHLRLPERYPSAGLPDVLASHDCSKNDLRNRTKVSIQALGLIEGEEALDAIIACFRLLIEGTDSDLNSGAGTNDDLSAYGMKTGERGRTVIIWLHHLLAPGKRKLAVALPASISGITKPGYPGVLVFAGPKSPVMEHVNTLKAENWQAFQVRYEGDECWEFAHSGVVEVETMSEAVAAVEFGAHGARRKQQFLEAVGIK